MLRFLTAGESHGKALTTIVEGIPSNLPIEREYINFHLKRRQAGYGRGNRMKIEKDEVEINSGIRYGKTLGYPIAMNIKNRDWVNWETLMSDSIPEDNPEKVVIPRPAHADLAGTVKYNFSDIRNSIERSSARETAARMAAGSIARRLLEEFGISVGSYVESIGNVFPHNNFSEKLFSNELAEDFTGWSISEVADLSSVRVLEQVQEEEVIERIKHCKKRGDTLGGTFIIIATGLPPGLGSFSHYDNRLDAALSHAVMSINAVKGVEIGRGFKYAGAFGSEMHDELIMEDKSIRRKTNNSGGIEGGISSSEPIIIRAAMKPIATLMSPLKSVDLSRMEAIESRRERSDFTAVPACSVIAESMVAWVVADEFSKKFGGDSLEEMKDNFHSWISKIESRLINNFRDH